jgi:hypothetical protein
MVVASSGGAVSGWGLGNKKAEAMPLLHPARPAIPGLGSGNGHAG